MALVVDTGPLLAALDVNVRDHARCCELLDDATEQIVVPAPVVVEPEWTTAARVGRDEFDVFLEDVEAGVIRPKHTKALRLLPDA